MKKVNFKMRSVVAIAICLATTAMFAVSCGGGSKKSDAEKEAQKIVKDAEDVIEKAGIKATATAPWPDNEYTKQLSKPEIGIKAAGTVKTGSSEMFSVTFADGTTKEQIKACVEKVKSDGFTQGASESDDSTYYLYSAKNSAGYSISVMWTDSPSSGGLMVSKK
jgi:biotin synthase-like enzyme